MSVCCVVCFFFGGSPYTSRFVLYFTTFVKYAACMAGKKPQPGRGAQVVQCLEETWSLLRAAVTSYSIPDAVIVVLAAGQRKRKLGHFAHSCWRYDRRLHTHEVAVSPSIFELPAQVLLTLLHEAVHAALFEIDGTGGTHPQGYYHNKHFRDTSLAFGMHCVFNGTRHGWNLTTWKDGRVPAVYRNVLRYLQTNMPLGTAPVEVLPREGTRTPDPGRLPMLCRCRPPRRIYASTRERVEGGIRCERCGENFKPYERG